MLSVREVAEQLSVSPDTIRRRCASGDFEGAMNMGTRRRSMWRIPAASVSIETVVEDSEMSTPMLDRFS